MHVGMPPRAPRRATAAERVTAMFIGAVTAALLLGFLAGLLAFRIKSRWCPECGATTITLQQRDRHSAQAK